MKLKSKKILDVNKISSIDNVNAQTFALLLLSAVTRGSEAITWSRQDGSLRFSNDDPIADPPEAAWWDPFMLELLTRQAKAFAGIGEGTPDSGSFLLLVGNHHLTVAVRVEEAIQVRLFGSKEASEAARECIRENLAESENLVMSIDDEGRVVRRWRATSSSGRPKTVVGTVVLIVLLLLIVGLAVARRL